MAQANASLSPKRQAEREQRFRCAVRTIALMRAKQAVKAQWRADGLKVSHFSAREIALQAEAYIAQHREELIARAATDVARFPEFANIVTTAQSQSGPQSITSAVQMSGAK
jgi:hypothetical protein